jgi:Dyp-type peroxidase family
MASNLNVEPFELPEIQGLILSGHNHLNVARYVFLQFGDAEQGKHWLAALAPQIATSEVWPKDPVTGKTLKPPVIANIGLTYTGLEALALPQSSLDSFPEDFRDGMTSERRSRILGDRGQSAPQHWEIGADAPTLHVVLILLAIDEPALEAFYAQHQALWDAHELTVTAELAAAKLPADREHFGFLDGIAQPSFRYGVRETEVSEPLIKPGEFVLGYKNQYDIFPISPQLNGADLGKNGSYLVFRKLYQDVVGFWNYIAEHALEEESLKAQTRSNKDQQVWLASKMVGRWPSGAPLAKYPDHDVPDLPREEMNDFLYWERDYEGYYCPRSAHIRRSNPRDTNGESADSSLKTSNSHLLIRRGMTYGPPLISADNIPPQNLVEDHQDRGIAFLAINASISRQFEFAQQTWSNNTKFDRLYNDKDPIIGDHTDADQIGNESCYDFTIQQLPLRHRLTNMPRFVTVKGGGYFFLPSITALKFIAES